MALTSSPAYMQRMMPAADLTLDEMRPLLAEAVAVHAPFDGWSAKALTAAASDVGIDPAAARLAFKGGGIEIIEAWLSYIDRRMVESLDSDTFRTSSIRRKIALAVRVRLELVEPHREALRRAVAILALPANLSRSGRLAWKTADGIWHAAGDTATDLNHYSKRLTLASIYGATLLVWLADDSDGRADTWAFLDRRIEGVMQFEKWKAGVRQHMSPDKLPSLSRFLGRLRYPIENS